MKYIKRGGDVCDKFLRQMSHVGALATISNDLETKNKFDVLPINCWSRTHPNAICVVSNPPNAGDYVTEDGFLLAKRCISYVSILNEYIATKRLDVIGAYLTRLIKEVASKKRFNLRGTGWMIVLGEDMTTSKRLNKKPKSLRVVKKRGICVVDETPATLPKLERSSARAKLFFKKFPNMKGKG